MINLNDINATIAFHQNQIELLEKLKASASPIPTGNTPNVPTRRRRRSAKGKGARGPRPGSVTDRVLKFVTRTPNSSSEFTAEALGITHGDATARLSWLKAAGLVEISGHGERKSTVGRHPNLYSAT